jgi:hypothetical protein
MKTRFLILLVSVCLLSTIGAAQAVVVTGKKITYQRPRPITDEKKTFWVNYPQVKAATPALSKKIESAISYEKVMALDVEDEINDVQWLEEANFDVGYNRNGVLTVTLSMYGVAAYPSSQAKTVVVDTRTGMRVKPADVFTNLKGLAAMVKKAQRREIARAIADLKTRGEDSEPKPESLFTTSNFTVADLEAFSVNGKGITFDYDYGFPHVILALQPDGKFFFTWAQLKPYIRRGGLLERFVR